MLLISCPPMLIITPNKTLPPKSGNLPTKSDNFAPIAMCFERSIICPQSYMVWFFYKKCTGLAFLLSTAHFLVFEDPLGRIWPPVRLAKKSSKDHARPLKWILLWRGHISLANTSIHLWSKLQIDPKCWMFWNDQKIHQIFTVILQEKDLF